MKVDVAIQSYKKPESLIYTLLSLKKYCAQHIDTIYINDDCSNDGTIDYYFEEKLKREMYPIKIKIRVNNIPSGFSKTLYTKKSIKKRTLKQRIQLYLSFFIKRFKMIKDDNDIRYQWAINNTDKKYLFVIHDDMEFYDDILGLYINTIQSNNNIIIVGDFGGSKRCPFGPCGEKKCSPELIMNGYRPSKKWPITGKYNLIYTLLGRVKRNCRVNEWCCLLDIEKTRLILEEEGVYFGNYEFGGDVACYWLDVINRKGYDFIDPLPRQDLKIKYYLHWWQGYEGHQVWINTDNKTIYKKDFIIDCLEKRFGYVFQKRKKDEKE